MSQYRPRDGVSQLTQLMRDAEPAPARRQRPPVDPRQRRRRRRRSGIVAAIAVLLVGASAAGYAFLTLTAPVGSAVSASTRPVVSVPQPVSYVLPPDGEIAVDVTGAEDYMGTPPGGILASSGGNDARSMASISKLITAMVILDAKPLGAGSNGSGGTGPTITFSKADHALYDNYYVLNATIAAMPTGSSMSEHDAIETMLVVSACNYADAMSTWAFGSPDAFLGATQRWLKKNGMTSTRLVEPTGIDDRNVSTPTDLITLGKLAAANPAIASIVAMPNLDVPGLDHLPNTNDLLGSHGITGMKTGTLGGSDLLFSASVGVGTPQNLSMIGVILDADSKSAADSAVTQLIDSIAAGFHQVPLATAGQQVGTYTTPWGGDATMVIGTDASVLTWSTMPITSTMTTTTLKTGANGSQVGSITWTAGKTVVTAPIVLRGRITPPSTKWRLTHPQDLISWWPGSTLGK